MNHFAEIGLGNWLSIGSIIISCLVIHRSRKKDVGKAAERVQQRHDENIAAMANLNARVKHLDDCMDKLRDQVYAWIMK